MKSNVGEWIQKILAGIAISVIAGGILWSAASISDNNANQKVISSQLQAIYGKLDDLGKNNELMNHVVVELRTDIEKLKVEVNYLQKPR